MDQQNGTDKRFFEMTGKAKTRRRVRRDLIPVFGVAAAIVLLLALALLILIYLPYTRINLIGLMRRNRG